MILEGSWGGLGEILGDCGGDPGGMLGDFGWILGGSWGYFRVWGWNFFRFLIFSGLVFAFLGCVCKVWCL